MKQFEHRCHHSTTFNIVVASLVVSLLGFATNQALAQEPTSTTPPTDSAIVAPSTVATTPDQPQASGDAPTTEELQNRLNGLDQRLDKVRATDLDPLLLLLPNVSSNVPNGYGASTGMAAIGVGYQNRIRFNSHRQDGTAGIVVGLSDPQKLGVDIQASVLDLSQPAHNTALGFKLHRQLGDDYAIAFGGEDAIVSSASDSGSSYYAVISKKLRLAQSSSEPFSRVYLSLGAGNGRFRSESDIFNDKSGINVFGSAAVNLNRSTMVFTEWNGQSLNAGASAIPFRKYPFVLTLALADLAGTAHNGARFTAGVSYVFAR